MITKLQRWAWFGGAALAAIAGLVNAVGLQSFAHQAVTHVTGTTSLISLSLARMDLGAASGFALIVASFVTGAAVSGFVIGSSALKLGRRYGLALFVESTLLFAASILMRSNVVAGSCFASAACGLQNAMASTYSGATLRTTHLTGMLTDVGAAVGHLFRGVSVDWIRVRLHLLLIGSFAGGGVLGSLLYGAYGPATLYIPAVLVGTFGMAYSAYAHWQRTRGAV